MARAPVNKNADTDEEKSGVGGDGADVIVGGLDLGSPDLADAVAFGSHAFQNSQLEFLAGRTVSLLSAASAREVPQRSLIVVCREPGFRRAGIEHPAVAVYPIDHFGDAELKQLAAEPNLELVAFV